MFKLYNGLYGNPDFSATFSRVGSDSEINYLKNLNLQPSDWIYRSKEVFYNRNSYGHRCAEPSSLKSPFILFTGCSITEGIALSIEDTYPYIVSKTLGYDYYNLGINGFGIDMLSLNLSRWFKNIKLIPDAVVIQWPQIHRKFELIDDTAVPIGPWHDKSDNIISKKSWENYSKIITTDYMEHYFDILKNTTTSYLQAMNIEIIEIPFEDVPLTSDRGRDVTHPGIESHKFLADRVLNSLGK